VFHVIEWNQDGARTTEIQLWKEQFETELEAVTACQEEMIAMGFDAESLTTERDESGQIVTCNELSETMVFHISNKFACRVEVV
jgi:hypothetical protein